MACPRAGVPEGSGWAFLCPLSHPALVGPFPTPPMTSAQFPAAPPAPLNALSPLLPSPLPPSSHTPLYSSTISPQGHTHTCIPMTSGFCHQLMLTSVHLRPFGPPLKLAAIQVRVRLLCSWAQSNLSAWPQPCVPPRHLPSEPPPPPRSSAGNPFPLGQHQCPFHCCPAALPYYGSPLGSAAPLVILLSKELLGCKCADV